MRGQQVRGRSIAQRARRMAIAWAWQLLQANVLQGRHARGGGEIPDGTRQVQRRKPGTAVIVRPAVDQSARLSAKIPQQVLGHVSEPQRKEKKKKKSGHVRSKDEDACNTNAACPTQIWIFRAIVHVFHLVPHPPERVEKQDKPLLPHFSKRDFFVFRVRREPPKLFCVILFFLTLPPLSFSISVFALRP